MYSNNDQAICYACGKVCKDHNELWKHIQSAHGNSRKPGMSNGQRIIAAVAGIALAASLFVAPAKAQVSPLPTPSIGEPPKPLHVVYLPVIQFPAEVHGCDDCQAVNWNSGKVA